MIPDFVSLAKGGLERKLSNDTRNSLNFRKVKSIFLSYLQKRGKGLLQLFVLIISKEDLVSLSNSIDVSSFDNAVNTALQLNDIVYLNSDLAVVNAARMNGILPCNPNDNNGIRRFLNEMSSSAGCVVFHLGPEGIHDFVDGTDDGSTIFFNEDDLKSYQRKRDISELDDVLEEYRVQLTHRHVYGKFYIPKSTIQGWFKQQHPGVQINSSTFRRFVDQHKHILKNKPEDLFREDLRAFLRDRIKNTLNFSKEYILHSFRRLDIYTEDENGNFYFLEIKWIGTSVTDDSSAPGTSYGPNDIRPAAFEQVLKYIKEFQEHRIGVKVGYLIVFDARADKQTDPDYLNNSSINTELHAYIAWFRRYPHFEVNNVNPN